jgi:hypothetical protein
MEEVVEKKKSNEPVLQPAVAGEAGYGLGVAGFVVSFFVGVAGIVLSAVALKQSKAAGRRNGLALAGLIIGIVKTALDVLAIVGIVIGTVWLSHYCANNATACSTQTGPGYTDQMPSMSQTY